MRRNSLRSFAVSSFELRRLARILVSLSLAILMAGCDKQAAPHLIVSGMKALQNPKKGFSIDDGQPTYHDWSAGTRIVKPLTDADPDSFFIFEQPKKASSLFARDNSHVFMARNCRPRVIQGAAPDSFELLTEDGMYAKDTENVYYFGVPIAHADPASFELLLYPFARDKDRAFIGTAEMSGVDRATWKPLRRGTAEDPWYYSTQETRHRELDSLYFTGWSRDGDSFYFGRDPVVGVHVPTFEVLSNAYAKDHQRVYTRHYGNGRFKFSVVDGADVASFAVHPEVDNLLRGFRLPYDAQDKNKQYRYGKPIDND